MSAKRFHRKDLKHDEFITVTGRATAWLMQRRRRIGWGLLVVALVLSVLLSVRFNRQRQEQRAATLLASAMEVYRAPVVPPLPDPAPAEVVAPEAADEGSIADAAAAAGAEADDAVTEGPEGATEEPSNAAAADAGVAADPSEDPVPAASEPPSPAPSPVPTPTGALQYASEAEKYSAARDRFRPIVERYEGRPSGRLAAFYLGICESELGDSAAAISSLTLAADASEPLIAAMAVFRLGQLELELGNAVAAVAHFDRLLERGGQLFPREEAMMAKARAQREAGDTRAALATYQRVADDFAGSLAAANALTQVEELAAQLGLDPNVEGS